MLLSFLCFGLKERDVIRFWLIFLAFITIQLLNFRNIQSQVMSSVCSNIPDPGDLDSFDDRNDAYELFEECILSLNGIAKEVKFFSAAEEVTGLFFLGSAEFSPDWYVSEKTEKFLQRLSAFLYEKNLEPLRQLLANPTELFDPDNSETRLSSTLEYDLILVEREQRLVQDFMVIDLLNGDITAENLDEITDILDLNWFESGARSVVSFGSVSNALEWAKEGIGSKLDFRDPEHREAIGKAIIFEKYGLSKEAYLNYIRQGTLVIITPLNTEILLNHDGLPVEETTEGIGLSASNLLDLIFVIDTTGSMRDDIDAVRADAINIINQVAAGGTDWRIAIVTYRDHPIAPYGDPGDYVSNVDLPFSADQGEIVNRLNAIQVGGGGDTNEAVFAGLLRAIGQDWRPGSRKIIILMGDAPPHSPDPREGYTRSMVLEAALAVDPANIYPIVIVDNNETRFEFQALADGSSGKLFYAADAVEVVPTILTTIGVAKGAQLVVGEAAQIASLMPEFPLRTGPTMIAAIIRNLPRSAVVTVIGGPELSIAETDLRQDFIWWQVRLEDGTEGWIPESTYGEPTLVPLSETSPLVEVTCTLTTIQGVNIRSGPGIQHEQIASRVGGELLAANGQNAGTEGFRWWQIIDGFWIREDLVREAGNCDGLPPVSPS